MNFSYPKIRGKYLGMRRFQDPDFPLVSDCPRTHRQGGPVLNRSLMYSSCSKGAAWCFHHLRRCAIHPTQKKPPALWTWFGLQVKFGYIGPYKLGKVIFNSSIIPDVVNAPLQAVKKTFPSSFIFLSSISAFQPAPLAPYLVFNFLFVSTRSSRAFAISLCNTPTTISFLP